MRLKIRARKKAYRVSRDQRHTLPVREIERPGFVVLFAGALGPTQLDKEVFSKDILVLA